MIGTGPFGTVRLCRHKAHLGLAEVPWNWIDWLTVDRADHDHGRKGMLVFNENSCLGAQKVFRSVQLSLDLGGLSPPEKCHRFEETDHDQRISETLGFNELPFGELRFRIS